MKYAENNHWTGIYDWLTFAEACILFHSLLTHFAWMKLIQCAAYIHKSMQLILYNIMKTQINTDYNHHYKITGLGLICLQSNHFCHTE